MNHDEMYLVTCNSHCNVKTNNNRIQEVEPVHMHTKFTG